MPDRLLIDIFSIPAAPPRRRAERGKCDDCERYRVLHYVALGPADSPDSVSAELCSECARWRSDND